MENGFLNSLGRKVTQNRKDPAFHSNATKIVISSKESFGSSANSALKNGNSICSDSGSSFSSLTTTEKHESYASGEFKFMDDSTSSSSSSTCSGSGAVDAVSSASISSFALNPPTTTYSRHATGDNYLMQTSIHSTKSLTSQASEDTLSLDNRRITSLTSEPPNHLPSAVLIGCQRAIAEAAAAATRQKQSVDSGRTTLSPACKLFSNPTMPVVFSSSECNRGHSNGHQLNSVHTHILTHGGPSSDVPMPSPNSDSSLDSFWLSNKNNHSPIFGGTPSPCSSPPSSPRICSLSRSPDSVRFLTQQCLSDSFPDTETLLPIDEDGCSGSVHSLHPHHGWSGSPELLRLVDSCRTNGVPEDVESIAESVYHQPPKAADRGAACRLAKRLFHLDGFRITDIAKHLCKRNDFSQLVGEEFANFFDFNDQTLDVALRTFLTKFSLTGETQERERVLYHFSRRYMSCKPNAYTSDDACHTLVCAIMLLNTDLHNQNVTRKMTCQEFINNLIELNGGQNFEQDELKAIYNSIKHEPIRWPHRMENPMVGLVNVYCPAPPGSTAGGGGYPMNGGAFLTPASSVGVGGKSNLPPLHPMPPAFFPSGQPLWNPGQLPMSSWPGGYPLPGLLPTVGTPVPHARQSSTVSPMPNEANRRVFGSTGFSPFLDLPPEVTAKEYMRGFVLRKWVMESHGKKTSLGKRRWKLLYARLRDLVLYLYKDAATAVAASRAEEKNLIYMQHLAQLQQQQYYQSQFLDQQAQQSDFPVAATPLAVATPDPIDVPSLSTLSASGNKTSSASTPTTGEAEASMGIVSNSKDLDQSLNPSAPADLVISEATDTPTNEPNDGKGSELVEATMSSRSPCLPLSAILAAQASGGDTETGSKAAASSTKQLQPPLDVSTKVAENLTFPSAPPKAPPPESIICIAHAFASRAVDYHKKQHVFRLRTKDGAEYLMQVNDAKELEFWVDKLNFVAALLSSPPLANAVGSERTFYRPHLPTGYTKLNMKEQLESHQRRIIELTRDLSDVRKRLNPGSVPVSTTLSSGEDTAPLTNPVALKPPTATTDSGLIDPSTVPTEVIIDPASTETTLEESAAIPIVEPVTEPASAKIPLSRLGRHSSCPTNPLSQTQLPQSQQQPPPAPPSPSLSSSSTSISLVSAFSTASLGRRKRFSSGSLGSGDAILSSRQRAEYEDRTAFVEAELTRYKTYARLLEAELVRMQNSAAAAAVYHHHQWLQQQQYFQSRPQGTPFLPGLSYMNYAGAAPGAPYFTNPGGHCFIRPDPLSSGVMAGPAPINGSVLTEEPLTPNAAANDADSLLPDSDDSPALPAAAGGSGGYYSDKRVGGFSPLPMLSVPPPSSRGHRYRHHQLRQNLQLLQQRHRQPMNYSPVSVTESPSGTATPTRSYSTAESHSADPGQSDTLPQTFFPAEGAFYEIL